MQKPAWEVSRLKTGEKRLQSEPTYMLPTLACMDFMPLAAADGHGSAYFAFIRVN